MGILAIIAIVFTFIQLGVAWVNRVAVRRFKTPPSFTLSEVSVLIPARNEASHLPVLLHDLLHLPARPREILVCDDHSTDATFEEVSSWAAYYPWVRVFSGAPLPPGWQGKNFACYQLASRASGKYLLFLDADVRVGGKDIQRTVREMQIKRLGLLSVFPRQIMISQGEKTTVPLMTYILLTLLPLPLVYRVPGQPSLAAANGQYMLFDARTYRLLQPHRQIRKCPTEDIAVSRYYKSRGQRVACLTGFSGIACRMYDSRQEAIRGFARSVAAFFGGSLWVAAGFWLLTSWGWLPVVLFFSWPVWVVYLLLRLLVRVFVSLAARQSVGVNLAGAVVQQVNLLCILWRAFRDRWKGQQEWKGRNILS